MSENNVASRGDFRGDFSRDTFDPMKHFSRVLMQQGRVQLDADWNEQVSILLHYMRQLGRDLMGPHGAPYPDDTPNQDGGEKPEPANFEINPVKEQKNKPDFSIAPGRYYVNGICCENEENKDGKELTFRNQHKELFSGKDLNNGEHYLVYLDVWERHLSYVEDSYMREKALCGADTATRAQIVWQVNVILKKTIEEKMLEAHRGNIDGMLTHYGFFQGKLKEIGETKPGTGQLKATAKKAAEGDKNPCMTVPEASYRGAENQLYRVEIHDSNANGGTATFKWSRENGSVIFPIAEEITGKTITLEHLGRDDRFSLQPGDWVEVLDDDVILRNEANPLLKVKEIDWKNIQVTLEGSPETTSGQDVKKHPYLRRWDQKESGGVIQIPVAEDGKEPDWIELEPGVQIQFPKLSTAAIYQTGDYWLIPARTATGDVEWPEEDNGQPKALPPHGVVHHYAPLAIITVAGGNVTVDHDLRRQLHCDWTPIS